jgi:hypothetical protein
MLRRAAAAAAVVVLSTMEVWRIGSKPVTLFRNVCISHLHLGEAQSGTSRLGEWSRDGVRVQAQVCDTYVQIRSRV